MTPHIVQTPESLLRTYFRADLLSRSKQCRSSLPTTCRWYSIGLLPFLIRGARSLRWLPRRPACRFWSRYSSTSIVVDYMPMKVVVNKTTKACFRLCLRAGPGQVIEATR